MRSLRLRLAMPLAALALAAPACGLKSEPVGALPSFPRKGQDGQGRSVTVEVQPARIVSLDPGLTETAFAVGAGANVVGASGSESYPSAARRIPSVLDGGQPESGRIRRLRPDLLLAPASLAAQATALGKELRVPVYVGGSGTLHDIEHDIAQVGALTGFAVRGRTLVQHMQSRIEAIRRGVSSEPPVRVFVDNGFFYTTPKLGPAPTITNVDSPPLHALRNSNGVVNGVFTKSATSAFPTSSNDAANYYVDPVFTPQTFTTPPGQVGNVNATAGFASATVSWSAPTTGDPATAYTITPYIVSTAQSPTTVPGNPAPTSAAVSGLTNGTTYTFTVTASNPAGTGPESAKSNAVTPSSSALHVDNGGFENGLTSWTSGGVSPPTASTVQVHSGGGSALLGTVQPSPQPNGDSNLSQTVAIPPTGTTTLTFWYRPSTADDICTGSGCAFDWQEAQVRNTAGQTLASIFKSNSNSQTWTKVTFDMSPYAGQNVVLWFNVQQDGAANPDDTWMYLDDVTLTQPSVPGAPTGVTATAANGSATVNWAAPADNGGSTITKYTVTPYIGSTAQTPVTVTGNPPATSTTVTGLTNGTTYTFRVSATNATGTGPDSSPSNAVTPNALPGAPTGVTANAGNGSATVSWSAPANAVSGPLVTAEARPLLVCS